MCPESAVNAHSQIQSTGTEIVGWYHSHPNFKVDPSVIDINNHTCQQNNFKENNKHIIAAIIGPFIDNKKIDSKLQFFHIHNQLPYKLDFQVIPQKLVPKSLIEDTKLLLVKYSSTKDRQNLYEDWNASHCSNKVEKFIAYIEWILLQNLNRLDRRKEVQFLQAA